MTVFIGVRVDSGYFPFLEMSPLQAEEDIHSKFQVLRLDDAPRLRRRYAAFVIKTTRERVFIFCMHNCYAFDRSEVKFPKGIKPGWWIGFERADDGGKHEVLQDIQNVRRAKPLFAVTADPKFKKIIYVHVKMIKRNLSIHPHLAERARGDEFIKTVPEELWCEEIGGIEDPEMLSNQYRESILYNATVQLEMDLDNWDIYERCVEKVKKNLFSVEGCCPKVEQPKVIMAPWIQELLTVDCISDNNELKCAFHTGLVVEEKQLVNIARRLLFLWNRELGKIQIKLENQHSQTLPDHVLGKLFKFKTTTIPIDDDNGYKMKVAVYLAELENAKNNLNCKIVSTENHHRNDSVMVEILINCPVGFAEKMHLYVDHAFFGELKIETNELRRLCNNICLDFKRFAGKQIPVYFRLDTLNQWAPAELDKHKVELAIET